MLVLRLTGFIPPVVHCISGLDCCCRIQLEGSNYHAMSDARIAVSWRRWQNTYFTIQETLGARLHRLSTVVDWPAGTLEKIPVGWTAGAGDIWAARTASTLNKLTN